MSRRNWTNVRMIAMLTSTARLERKTLDSMATPCSVNAEGGSVRRDACVNWSQTVTSSDEASVNKALLHLKSQFVTAKMRILPGSTERRNRQGIVRDCDATLD